MKKTVPIIIVAIMLIVVGIMVYTYSTDKKAPQLANPAAEKCVKEGATLDRRSNDFGEYEICKFKDGSECEEWSFFHDLCKKGEFKDWDKRNVVPSPVNGTNVNSNETPDVEPVEPIDQVTNEAPVDEPNAPADGASSTVPTLISDNIKVETPLPNTEVTSPFEVKGQARVFENQVHVDIVNTQGTVLIAETTIAQSPDAGQRGAFKIKISYEFSTTKEGFVDVYNLSARDGSKENLIRIPVFFK